MESNCFSYDYIMTSFRNDLRASLNQLPGGIFMSLVIEQRRNSLIQLWPSSGRRTLMRLSNLCDPEGLQQGESSPLEARSALEIDDKEGKSKRRKKKKKS